MNEHGPGYVWQQVSKHDGGPKALEDAASQVLGLLLHYRKKGVRLSLKRLIELENLLDRQAADFVENQVRSAELVRFALQKYARELDTSSLKLDWHRSLSKGFSSVIDALDRHYPSEESSPVEEYFLPFVETTLADIDKARKINGSSTPLLFAIDDVLDGGLWLEFGVGKGTSLKLLGRRAEVERAREKRVFGFDSFEGLPEYWRPMFPKGRFATSDGNPPRFSSEIERRVAIRKGRFRETLPTFLASRPGAFVSLLHVDCDLYSSALYVLSALLQGGHIRRGTVIVFDELFNYSGFENGELRALYEIRKRFDFRYRWRAFCGGGRHRVGSASLVVTRVGDDEDVSSKVASSVSSVAMAPTIPVSRGLYVLDGELRGKDKFNGAEIGSDGKIYFIPANARRVARVDPLSDRVEWIGPDLGSQRQKWLRGYLAPDGCIYGVPCCASNVLRIDTKIDPPAVTVLEPTSEDAKWSGDWRWHGGVVGRDGNLVCVPANAKRVLKIHVPSGKLSTFGGGDGDDGRSSDLLDVDQQFYGGLISREGNVYCIPQNGERVLKICPEKSTVEAIGSERFPGSYKWHGGCYSPVDDCVYGIPNHTDVCLRIDPQRDVVETFGDRSAIRKSTPRNEGKYKYEGGVVGTDGNIYLMPGAADRVLKIVVPRSPEERPRVSFVGGSFANARKTSDKWQNGKMGDDGCIYGIPVKAQGVLRIDLKTQDVCSIHPKTLGPLLGLDKYQGAVKTPNGSIYCVPFMSRYVLKIVPKEITASFKNDDEE